MAARIEIDLRKEFQEILYGSELSIPKGQLAILRRMQWKDPSVYPIYESDLVLSPSYNELTKEPDVAIPSHWSDREKFLYTEEWIVVYTATQFNVPEREDYRPWGQVATQYRFFYMEHQVWPSQFDKIIEPAHDGEGNLISPVRAFWTHAISKTEPFRDDYGRICYWRCATTERY